MTDSSQEFCIFRRGERQSKHSTTATDAFTAELAEQPRPFRKKKSRGLNHAQKANGGRGRTWKAKTGTCAHAGNFNAREKKGGRKERKEGKRRGGIENSDVSWNRRPIGSERVEKAVMLSPDCIRLTESVAKARWSCPRRSV